MDRMSELTKKLHILKTGGTEEEVTLYDSTDDCEEPYLSFTVDGANAYAKLGDTTDGNATSLRIYRNSDKATYAVLTEAEPAVIIDDLFTQTVMRTVTEIVDDGEKPPITSIGKFAFAYCSSLKTVNLPVATSIGDNAFLGCSLTTVSLPKVTSVGSYAFLRCSITNAVNLPAATYLDAYVFMRGYVKSVSLPVATTLQGTFYYCYTVTTVSAPKATTVKNETFWACPQLTSVDLSSVTTIQNSAFYKCPKLTTINLPKATSIGDSAFGDCSNLTAIHFASTNESKITALSGYSNKFGATNATIYFDL